MSDHYTDDGCGLSGAEALSLLKIGLMSDGELHPDSPVEGNDMLWQEEFLASDKTADLEARALSNLRPTDRGLLLLAAPVGSTTAKQEP